MEHTTTIVPGALHFVTSRPTSDPAPAVILSPNDTNYTSEQDDRPVQGAAGSRHDGTQMDIDLADSLTETSNQPPGLVTTDSGMQMDFDTVDDITETIVQAPTAEEPQSFFLETHSISHYTTFKAVRGAEPEATNSTRDTFSEPALVDVESSDDVTTETTAILEDTQTRPIKTSIESDIVELASLFMQSEDAIAYATATPRNTVKIPVPTHTEPKAMEPTSTEPAATEASTTERSKIEESEHARPTELDPNSFDVDNLYPEVARTGDGGALEGPAEEGDNTPDEFKQLHIPKKTPEKASSCFCGCCRTCKYGLRPMEKDDGYVSYPNHVPDNDKTGDFVPQPEGPIKLPKQYKSKEIITDVEMEDGEENEEEVEESGADIEMFDKTIPYNQNDPVITDKQSYEDKLLDDDDAFNTKGKKRARAGASESSRPTKRAKKMVIKEVVKEPTTILETIQRLSTPKTTKLSYPITFDGGIDTCSICKRYNYAILGLGVRKIKVYDYGKGKGPVEISDAIEADLSSPPKRKPAATSLCKACTKFRMQIMTCKKHAIELLEPDPTMDIMPALTRLIHNEPPSEDEVWCSICPSPAHYTCCAKTVQGVKGCGLKVCKTCAAKLQTTHEGNLGTMLKYLDDEVTEEYKAGLRADVELLRKDGPLKRYMSLNSKGKGKAAA